MKARHRLASELDIKRILSTLRYLRSAVKYMTSHSERNLLRMQAKPIVVDESRNHRKELANPVEQKTLKDLLRVEESTSDFDSTKQFKFMANLIDKDFWPKQKHLRLICGVFDHR